MQLVSKATTPKEARDEIVKFVQFKAAQHRGFAACSKNKSSKAFEIAAAIELEELAGFIDSIQDGAK